MISVMTVLDLSAHFCFLASDEISSTVFGFCGGAIELSEASQFVTLSSPFFGNPSADTDAFMYCTMHIKSSSGEQITLTFLDLKTTANEQVRVYDHPSSTTYLLGSFRGDLQEGDAVIVSSRGGLTLVYEDDSDSANGPGFLAQAQIQGVHVCLFFKQNNVLQNNCHLVL